MENSYTNVTQGLAGWAPVWQCNDCGAHAPSKEKVKHFKTCKPGESEKWQKFYEEEEQDRLEGKENHYFDTRW